MDIQKPELTWWNVTGASSFVLIAGKKNWQKKPTKKNRNIDSKIAAVSLVLGTKLELSLIISGLRCVIQLSLMVRRGRRKNTHIWRNLNQFY